MSLIPVMRPKMPSAERLKPYLQSIDAARTYSNFGPLALRLEALLAQRYGLAPGHVVSVANATLGLSIALAVQQPPPGSLCVMPAWTFIASAHAAITAGLVPYFVDVDPETWALDPGGLADVIARAPEPVGAVMPVAPFGLPLDVAAWTAFGLRHRLTVVIDAAAGFDALVPGAAPSVVSLHATKVIGAGEGGFIISADAAFIAEARMRANFGFAGSRLAQAAAYNAKLSEYHAAVGLASLDEWTQVRAEWEKAAGAYRRALKGSNRVSLQPGFGETWVSSTCLLSFADPIANRVERAFVANDIETRQWWGAGAHRHPATASLPHTYLPVTERLVRSTLAAPFYRDMSTAEIDRVAQAVLHSIQAIA